MKRAGLLLAAVALAACGGAEPAPAAPPPPPVASPTPRPVSSAVPLAERENAISAEIQATLAQVARVRGLPVKHPVKSMVLDRASLIARIKTHLLADIPADVLAAEGESMVGFELIPADYDFVGGILKMLQGQIAGLYLPEDKTIYVVDDLSGPEAEETVAHELVHALQDQSFDIDKSLKFKVGDSDRISAAHALIEGDATAAMMDVSGQSSLDTDPALLAKLMFAASAISAGGGTPPVFVASLVSPYADGFAFVQERRKAGGWEAVNAAFRRLPATTEQLLHPDKYASNEPALLLPSIDVGALGPGFTARLEEGDGEQGLRDTLAVWSTPDNAAAAASGWGGDRGMLAEKKEGGHSVFASAYRVRFDAPKLADKMAVILKQRWSTACRERGDLGPVTWRRKGADIVMVGGPYARDGKTVKSAGTCADANRWVDAILKVK